MKESVRLTSSDNECPLCGQKSKVVPLKTVRALIKDEFLKEIRKDQYYLCTNHTCEATYFNSNKDVLFTQNGLKEEVWFKENAKNPIVCYCNHVTLESLISVIDSGADTLCKVKERLPISYKPHCKTTHPTGECCEKYVVKYIDKYKFK